MLSRRINKTIGVLFVLLLLFFNTLCFSSNMPRMMGPNGELTEDQKKLRMATMTDKEKKEMSDRYQKRLDKMTPRQIERMEQRAEKREKYQQEKLKNRSKKEIKRDNENREKWLGKLTPEQRAVLQ
ncbi:MAG: hypothetical protein GY694_10170 [Gammaproteobacteria bacterium]|nr:hypothetical protein [Gammaproteobacteria bacterium]